MYGTNRSALEAAAEQRVKLLGGPFQWLEIMAKIFPMSQSSSAALSPSPFPPPLPSVPHPPYPLPPPPRPPPTPWNPVVVITAIRILKICNYMYTFSWCQQHQQKVKWCLVKQEKCCKKAGADCYLRALKTLMVTWVVYYPLRVSLITGLEYASFLSTLSDLRRRYGCKPMQGWADYIYR